MQKSLGGGGNLEEGKGRKERKKEKRERTRKEDAIDDRIVAF